MFSFFTRIKQFFRYFTKARGWLGTAFAVVLEIVLVLVVLGILLAINLSWPELQRQVKGPPWFQQTVLPLLGLLVYLFGRIAVYVWRILLGNEAFPDIQDAVFDGLDALEAARIPLKDAPIFLVLGLTAEEEAAFAEQPAVAGPVRRNQGGMPLHWYANNNAIWITLPGVSALTQQVRRPAEVAPRPASAGASAPAEFGASLVGGGAGASLAGGAAPSLGGEAPAPAGSDSLAFPAGPGGSLVAGSVGGSLHHAAAPADRASPIEIPRRLGDEERSLARRRLTYLARVLRDLRGTVCTINGIVVALPYRWMLHPEAAQLADAAGVDLLAADDSFGVRCSVVVVFTGIQASEGFVELIRRLGPQQLRQRLGCGLPSPSLFTLDPRDLPAIHRWMVQNLENQAFSTFRRKLEMQENGRLVRLLAEFRAARPHFEKVMLGAFFERNLPVSFYLSGVYFAALGPVDRASSPFFGGVLERLEGDHGETICWNETALDEDAGYRRWTYVAIAAAVLLTILDAALVVSLFQRLVGRT